VKGRGGEGKRRGEGWTPHSRKVSYAPACFIVAAVYSRTVSYLILLELGFRERRRIIINFLETLLIIFDVSPHI
jgi:hypothetical protein